MSSFAMLFHSDTQTPRSVRLVAESDALQLWGSDGMIESVPWWRLYRTSDFSSVHHFRRLDRRTWELRVTAGSDRELLAHVGRRPLHRLLHPLRRLESLKVLAGILVLAITLAQHAPADWLARTIPDWGQRRLVDPVVGQLALNRCSRPGGEAAIRKILTRLDPALGRKIDIVAMRDGGFVVTSAPGDTLFLYRSSMSEVDAAALPALLAHELSHIRHRDALAATIRKAGFLGTWAAILEARGDRKLEMNFSGLEERRADIEAMRMMRRAGIPLRPAAAMFERTRVSKEQGGFYGYDQRDFHFGIDARAQRWAAAARSDPPRPSPLLTGDEEDDLYNFCWPGRIPPLPVTPERAPRQPPAPPGQGSLRP